VHAEVARFVRRADAVRRVRPDLGAELLAAAHAVQRHARDLPVGPSGLVHGDCKPSQFLLGPAGVALLDFDHCGVADPASDVGTFLAALRQLQLRQHAGRRSPPGRLVPVEAHAWRHDFLAGYRGELAGGNSDGVTARIAWYESVALVRKALRAFARAPHSLLPAAMAAEAYRCLSDHPGEAA
jgi:aminoglycoside phosphotransferase (APT) family kinase protein